jgi:Tol biopolymer transport system component
MKRILLIGILIAGSPGSAQRMKSVNEDVQSGQVVFSSASQSSERPWTLVLLDLATGSQRSLAEYGGGNRPEAPAWSPDGKQLVYSLNESCLGVFLYDLDSGRQERLDQPTERGEGCRAAWSPDGRFIAYQSSRDLVLPDWRQMVETDAKAREAFSLNYYNLYVVDLQTRTHRQLTTKSGGYPVWSPDAQWILYYAPAREARLFRIRPDGSGEEEFPKLPDPRQRARMLSWSSDGKRIALSTWPFPVDPTTFERSEAQVYTADASGSHLELLTPEKWKNAAPVWAPQGTELPWS